MVGGGGEGRGGVLGGVVRGFRGMGGGRGVLYD